MTDKKPVPPALAEFALEQLAEAGEQAAIDLTVQNVEILRAEIVKRDARIVGLEAELETTLIDWGALRLELAALKAQQPSSGVVDERSAFESWVKGEWPEAPLHYVRDALPKNDPRYGEYVSDFILRSWIGWQARARLDQPTASAGVVLPERMQEVRSWGYDMGGNYEEGLADGYNNAIDDVARLNPCRAQAVPDGYVLVPAVATDQMTWVGQSMRHDTEISIGSIYCAMIAAAPSANSEQARACATCNGVGIIGHSTLCPECAAAPSAKQKESGDE